MRKLRRSSTLRVPATPTRNEITAEAPAREVAQQLAAQLRERPYQPPAGKKLCGARKKHGGQPCRGVALRSGRCKWHGGLSTGPRTPEGRARIAESNRRRAEAKRANAAHFAI